MQRRSYVYRPDGYVTRIDDHLASVRRFDLDPIGRVTAVHGAGWTERYAYDPAGNITHAAWPSPQAETLEAEAQGEREYAGTLIRRAGNVRYQHDAQGRVTLRQQKRLSAKPRTWHYTWDADDRLVAVTTPDGQRWQYLYDPLGRRIAKQRLGDDASVVERVDFAWDGVVLAEQTHTDCWPGTSEPAGSRTTVWNWEPDSFRPVSQTERTALRDAPQEWIDEQFYAIVTDLVGTPTEMVDADGAIAWHLRTTLWGTAASPRLREVECSLRFPGQYFDSETQLNYNYYRYYDALVGCYGIHDILGVGGGTNTRSYVANPLVWHDPLGLAPCPRLVQAGEDLANRVGKNRVTIGMGDKRYTIDLRGRAHFEKSINQWIDTPHVKFYELHVGPTGQGSWRGGVVREAIWDDIRMVRKYLDKIGL